MGSFCAVFGFRSYISNAWLAYVITSVRCVISLSYLLAFSCVSYLVVNVCTRNAWLANMISAKCSASCQMFVGSFCNHILNCLKLGSHICLLPNVYCSVRVASLGKKATIHQVTTMLATSKNVLFPGSKHLLTTGTDDLTL